MRDRVGEALERASESLRPAGAGGGQFEGVGEIGPEENQGVRRLEIPAERRGGAGIGPPEIDRAHGIPPAARHVHVGRGRHRGEREMVVPEIQPPDAAEPAVDLGWVQPAVQQHPVVRRGKIHPVGAGRQIVREFDVGVVGEEVHAVDVDPPAGRGDFHAMRVQPAGVDATGQAGELPAGIKHHLGAERDRVAKHEIRGGARRVPRQHAGDELRGPAALGANEGTLFGQPGLYFRSEKLPADLGRHGGLHVGPVREVGADHRPER